MGCKKLIEDKFKAGCVYTHCKQCPYWTELSVPNKETQEMAHILCEHGQAFPSCIDCDRYEENLIDYCPATRQARRLLVRRFGSKKLAQADVLQDIYSHFIFAEESENKIVIDATYICNLAENKYGVEIEG